MPAKAETVIFFNPVMCFSGHSPQGQKLVYDPKAVCYELTGVPQNGH